nr:unnamed protein product [Digitaria exilis]
MEFRRHPWRAFGGSETSKTILGVSVLEGFIQSFSDTAVMAFFKPSLVFCLFLTFLSLNCGPCHVFAKVYMVVMEDDPVISYKVNRKHIMRGEEAQKYKQVATTKHDSFLDSFLPIGSYKKLYSYTHLINGFALHAESAKTIRILSRAKGVRLIQEDIKMVKTTTHTPNYIGASGVWPLLGGSEHAGDGVVIGMIDTGIDPKNPSFVSSNMSSQAKSPLASFKGICRAGNRFPADSCNGKIVGARWFARAAQESGEFNATIHYASPYDSDGHGSHTASIAAGNFHTPVMSRGYNFGYASGMAPGARLAIYKAAYPFGGYMSDVIAAVDQAVEDGVDVISLSMAPSSVSPGPASFLNLLEVQLLLATKAGVSVVQAVGNAGPDENTVVSFSPWILSVAASTTDRKYRKSIIIGNGKSFSCGALSAPTQGEIMYPLALADDVMVVNSTDDGYNKCGDPKIFIKALVQGKALMRYYNNNTVRDEVGNVVSFGATARILEGRHATYTGEAPVVADYSSRGPDVENSQLQPAEVLKPNVMAPGHLIWGAWSPTSDAMPEIRGESYALLSGTSMAAPHVAGVAALIKQQHPTWSPAMVMSAIMTSADATDRSGTTFLCSVPGVDDAAVLRAVGAPCPPPPPAARAGAGAAARWCSDLNAASVTVASLVGSRRVERRVTSVGAENETYAAYVRAPEGVAVRVWPAEFAIAPGATRTLRIVLNATAPGSAFSFGEVVLRGDRKHRVRIPLAVYPTSKLSP